MTTPKLTKSQKATINRLMEEGNKVTNITQPLDTHRARVTVMAEKPLVWHYHLYIGKRGKVYETASLDY